MRERDQHMLGLWIVGAAVMHSLLLIIGLVAVIELQKNQFRQGFREVQQRVQQLQESRKNNLTN